MYRIKGAEKSEWVSDNDAVELETTLCETKEGAEDLIQHYADKAHGAMQDSVGRTKKGTGYCHYAINPNTNGLWWAVTGEDYEHKDRVVGMTDDMAQATTFIDKKHEINGEFRQVIADVVSDSVQDDLKVVEVVDRV